MTWQHKLQSFQLKKKTKNLKILPMACHHSSLSFNSIGISSTFCHLSTWNGANVNVNSPPLLGGELAISPPFNLLRWKRGLQWPEGTFSKKSEFTSCEFWRWRVGLHSVGWFLQATQGQTPRCRRCESSTGSWSVGQFCGEIKKQCQLVESEIQNIQRLAEHYTWHYIKSYPAPAIGKSSSVQRLSEPTLFSRSLRETKASASAIPPAIAATSSPCTLCSCTQQTNTNIYGYGF